ncbi:WD40-repeat-containing domain protein [Lipomyces japonicus]|uniref:WD40-repeat-containing domain protein n=1 Tax=Lipomyces japonicus TaxID=56871 RepID=UPI0034CE40ED
MTIKRTSVWAPLPSTAKGVSLHVSHDTRTDRIVYASNKSIHLRSLKNPSESTQYTQHIATTTVAKFAPSGYYVASGDSSGQVKVWDSSSITDDAELTKGTFPIINGRITDLSWDSDSKRIIAVGDGKERFGHCFTFDTGNSVGEISGHSVIINAVDIKPVRPFRAATVSDDSSLVWYTGPPFKFVKSVRGQHKNFVQDVRFSPDGAYAVSVGADRNIVIYDGREGDMLVKLEQAHNGSIYGVTTGKDENGKPVFATASADGSVKLWAYADDIIQEKFFWQVSDEHVVGVQFTSSTTLVAVSLSGDIHYLSVQSSVPSKVVYGHQKAITSLKVSDGGASIYSGSYDGRVVKWESKTGKSTVVGGAGHANLVVDIVEVNGKIFTSAWDDTIKSITGTDFNSSTVNVPSQPKGIVAAGEYLIVATEDAVYGYTTAFEALSTYKVTDSSAITSVGASSSLVAVGKQNGSVTLLSLPDLKTVNLPKIAPLRAAVSVVSFAPVVDEKGRHLLALGDSTGKITVVNAAHEGGVVTTRWAFHTGRVTSISWRADGKYAATGSLDTNVFIYSVDTPAKNVKTLNAHKDGVNVVAWVGEDKIVSAGADATIKWWDVTV